MRLWNDRRTESRKLLLALRQRRRILSQRLAGSGEILNFRRYRSVVITLSIDARARWTAAYGLELMARYEALNNEENCNRDRETAQ